MTGGDRPVALVTGGARGLGREIVAAFGAAGYSVATCGRRQPEPPPAGAEFRVCDVRDPDQVASLVSAVSDRFGRIDVVVNNAGGTPYADAATLSPRLFERVVALNLLGPFYVAQQANRVMQGQEGGGVIVNIGSTAAIRPAPGSAAYVAAKSAVTGLTRALALEWAPKVRVVQVTPGLMRTELVGETYGLDPDAVAATVPAGRFGRGADVAAACLALCRPGMEYVTGSELVVDGGGETPAWLLAFRPGAVAGNGEQE
ncbi:MAG TPA: SDR family oxidoreductase [Acidimicrobiales bacterium]|nr:SDR family oxidoreductase [Acidimicrobiales bacterium]